MDWIYLGLGGVLLGLVVALVQASGWLEGVKR